MLPPTRSDIGNLRCVLPLRVCHLRRSADEFDRNFGHFLAALASVRLNVNKRLRRWS